MHASRDGALAPLPPELMAALGVGTGPAPKRERTRRQLVAAALQVFRTRDPAAATMQEIAEAAGMATATVYNHFASKDELLQAVAVWIADSLCRRIADSYRDIPEGAERMAIGNRRYLWLAQQSPQWALLLLEVATRSPALLATTATHVLADLRLGVRQKAFKITSEAAALDLVNGTITSAMRSLGSGSAPARHAEAVTALVLAGLGLPMEQARAIVKRPLPPLPTPSSEAPAPQARRRAARAAA